MKIIIVGAGPSGLVCALRSKNDNNEVIILEKEKEVGKKLLVTGSGKCNYYNDNMSLDKFHSYNESKLKELLNEEELVKVKDFYSDLGIIPFIRNDYYYPITKDSKTIRNTLLNECLNKGIKVITDYKVEKIEQKNNSYLINNDLSCDILVLATGSYSYYKESNSYDLLKNLNLKIEKTLPSLVQLETKSYPFLKKWHGVRSEVEVSLYEDNNFIKKEQGEIQLTNYGVSGICIFNLSSYVSKGLVNNKKEIIKIDFVKDMSSEELTKFLEKEDIKVQLEKLINYKLIPIILDNTNNINDIVNNLKSFSLEITNTKSFSNSQVTIGGLSLEELSSNFESIKYNNLFIIGEEVDIDGDCGGYNLTFAVYSGLKAGNSIYDKN